MSRRFFRLAALSLVFVSLAASRPAPAGAQANDRLLAARAQVRSGQYAQALEGLQWVWQYGAAVEPAISGVRVSFLLLDWRRLGEVYPPAQAALVAARDAAEQKVRANPSDLNTFGDLLALEQHLPAPQPPLARFEQIALEHPDAAKALFPVVKRAAMDARRIDLLRTYGFDAASEFATAKQSYEISVKYNTETLTLPDGKPRPQGLIELTRQTTIDRFVSQSAKLIGVAVALGDLTTARSIQTQALAIAPDDPQLKAALPPR
jgi:hypothetical protein